MGLDRRSFLQLLGTGALGATVSDGIARALAIPANNKSGTIADVEHIVVLMQENRSFDHYFGTLRGVRGFGDPRAVRLADGHSVFHQPDGAGGQVLPFHPPAAELGLKFLADLDHDWNSTQAAWNQGRYDQWVSAKTSLTMAYLERKDIPYHYALADAFTVCDAYHCSLLGPTDPNRYHLFTGWVGNSGAGGGPVIDNSEAGYTWTTLPEVLESAGIGWKIYQDIGLGLDAAGGWGNTQNPHIGTYGDNSLLFFEQYRRALPGSALYDKARTGTHVAAGGTLFDQLRRDVSQHALPQVSWVVAPEAYSEHPNWPANYGAYYMSQILDALTADPAIWSKTALFVVYDENDGFFDHMVPPTPPPSAAAGDSNVATTHELFTGSDKYAAGPYGLGPRVPMLVISPWSKGGWVNSEVFDHTSIIRFIQKRFGTAAAPLAMPNITAWRSAVCGDLTSAFDFTNPNATPTVLPSTAGYAPPDERRHDDYLPAVPLVQSLPAQEVGTRPARALPYVLNVDAAAAPGAGEFTLGFVNDGRSAAVFHVRCANSATLPRSYTVAATSRLRGVWSAAELGAAPAQLCVYGPNGFFRAYHGSLLDADDCSIRSWLRYDDARGGVILTAANDGAAPVELSVMNAYAAQTRVQTLAAGATLEQFVPLDQSYGWYDLTLRIAGRDLQRQFAGHLENGRAGTSDPAMGAK